MNIARVLVAWRFNRNSHSRSTFTMNPSFTSRRLLRLAPLAAALLAGAGLAHAQLFTPAQFVEACRTSPANTVVLTQQTKFQTSFEGTTFQTPTGCTVVLAQGASFELDTITMQFGGPFVVQAPGGGGVVLDKATLRAPSVALSLTGFEGKFQMNTARLVATAGDISIQFGEKGFMEIKDSGRWYQPRLSAQGRLSIAAGASFTGSIVQSGLQGAAGISMAFNGTDSGMKIEASDLLLSSGAARGAPYITGPFTVTGAAAKVAFEMINVNLMEASQAVTVALNGAESKLGWMRVSSQTSSRRISLTAQGEKGEVKLENALMYGLPEVVIESGAMGSVSVTNSPGSITASQLIRIRAGLGGSCSASTVGLNAPVLQVCR
jgi:hypothetical protein